MILKNPSAGDILHYMGKGFKVTKVERIPQNRFVMDERGERLEFIKPKKEVVMEDQMGTVEKMTKPHELSDAIEGVGQISKKLSALIVAVGGGGSDKGGDEAAAVQKPSLSEILTQGPKRIYNYIEKAENKIAELKNILF